MRWTPSHSGVEVTSRQTGRSRRRLRIGRTLDPAFIAETSLSHLRRVTTERRASATQAWIRERVGRRHRYRLFVRCRRWAPEIRRLWQRVEADCEWLGPRAPTVSALFGNPQATPALLEFLDDTRVGRMHSQVHLKGGGERSEEDLEVVELEAPEEDDGTEESEEEDGPGLPL